MTQDHFHLFSLFRKGIIKIIWNNEQFLSLPINAFCYVVQNNEIAVDLRLTPGIGPGPQAVTPFGQTMLCPASVVLPPSSCPPQRSNRLEALLEYPSWFMVIFWPFDGFLNRGEEGFESALGQERTQVQGCYERRDRGNSETRHEPSR